MACAFDLLGRPPILAHQISTARGQRRLVIAGIPGWGSSRAYVTPCNATLALRGEVRGTSGPSAEPRNGVAKDRSERDIKSEKVKAQKFYDGLSTHFTYLF